MDIVFKKSQLRLIEDIVGDNKKPALAVSNSENDNDTSSLQRDISKVNQANTNGADLMIDTDDYTTKNSLNSNPMSGGKELAVKNSPGAAAEIQKVIDTSSPATLPSKIRITNGTDKGNNLVEVTTFKKKDLDKFLESL